MRVRFDRLVMSKDGSSIVLTGACNSKKSKEYRTRLLRSLNVKLPAKFHISMRSWDRKESEFDKLHCRIAFLKRPLDMYPAFLDSLQGLTGQFLPISFFLKVITLVHHRYRSLEPPHEGEFSFPLDPDLRGGVSAAVFVSRVNLG
jgi:hypothetical protein